MFGGLEVLQCYNLHKTEGFCTVGCYKGATEVLQVLQKESGNRKIEKAEKWGEKRKAETTERRETRRRRRSHRPDCSDPRAVVLAELVALPGDGPLRTVSRDLVCLLMVFGLNGTA